MWHLCLFPSKTVAKRRLFTSLLALVVASKLAQAEVGLPYESQLADFGQESASMEARQMADWIIHSGDHQQLPFLIVDKKNAKVFVLNPAGKVVGASAALLGQAIGDDSVIGIGQRKLSSIPPAQRTTPAGRFVSSLSTNLNGKSVLWVDYDAAISLHRVITSNAKQKRAQRLASGTVEDNRISFGCINVRADFYDQFIERTFRNTSGIVYVLPETRSIQKTFAYYAVDAQRMASTPSAPAEANPHTATNNVVRLR